MVCSVSPSAGAGIQIRRRWSRPMPPSLSGTSTTSSTLTKSSSTFSFLTVAAAFKVTRLSLLGARLDASSMRSSYELLHPEVVDYIAIAPVTAAVCLLWSTAARELRVTEAPIKFLLLSVFYVFGLLKRTSWL